MNIILFPGTFNCFHDGHMKILKNAIKKINPDKIYIIPTNLNPEKQHHSSIILNQHKINMIEIYTKGNKNILIDKNELNCKDYVPTYKTIAYYVKKYPNSEIFLLMGSDLVDKFYTWDNYKYIINHVNIICYKRSNNDKDTFIKIINTKIFKMSSTDIRLGKKLTNVSKELINYINNNNLYWYDRLNYRLSKKRLTHSINVGDLSKKYAKYYNLNENNAFYAAIYHDYFKELKNDKIHTYLITKYLTKKEQKLPISAHHSHIASAYIKNKWNYNNTNVLNSIKYHTIPSLEMSDLNMYIYCVDKLSKERSWEGVKAIRDILGKKSIKYIYKLCIKKSILHLKMQKKNYDQNYYKRLLNKL